MNWNESENKNKEKVKFKTHESVLYVLIKDFDDWFYKRMILKLKVLIHDRHFLHHLIIIKSISFCLCNYNNFQKQRKSICCWNNTKDEFVIDKNMLTLMFDNKKLNSLQLQLQLMSRFTGSFQLNTIIKTDFSGF